MDERSRFFVDPLAKKKYAAGSEQISLKWIEGAERVCVKCGVKITNLAKQVGIVRTVFPGRRREIVCVDCLMAPARKTLGIDA